MIIKWPTICFLLCAINVQLVYAQLTDPTRPFQAQAVMTVTPGTRSGFTVNAILVSAHRQLAAVNGQYVQVGDTVGDKKTGAKVIAIQGDLVELQDAKGRFTVTLYPDVKQSADESTDEERKS